jgi:hypothetical protein
MRIEWVALRLNNWALYKARESGGGLGFSSQASFLNEVDSSRYRESIIPIDETDASVTNDGVESLKASRPALYDCLQTYYVTGPGGIKGTALLLGIAPSSVHANLAAADRALANWFTDRQSRQALHRAGYTALQK